jgi:hypothetical protein
MSKAVMTIKRFKFRIKPHEVMKEEYPQSYYKFRNEKVAKAFFYESCGNQYKLVKNR